MPPIELTLANHGREWDTLVDQCLGEFTRETRVGVSKTIFAWEDFWKSLVDISVHRSNADLSEVGSTWIPSLVSMNSLRPFQPADINALGGVQAFMPGAWSTSTVVGSKDVWSIPFMSDVRVIYYWRDMLEKAGIDESTAFESFGALRNTLERLRSVVPTPLLLETDPGNHNIVYQIGTWLWAAGSDFVSEDGKSTLLGRPEAREALREHFELARYMRSGQDVMDTATWRSIFLVRNTAVTISGPWLATELFRPTPLPTEMENLGVVCLPGPGFVGGLNFVIWNSSRQEEAVIKLLSHLLRPDVQVAVGISAGNIPISRQAADALIENGRPQIKVYFDALRMGRATPAIPLWGVTEQRLTEAFGNIWRELTSSSDVDVASVLEKRLPPLERRLDALLGG